MTLTPEQMRAAGQYYERQMQAFKLREKALPLAVAALGPRPNTPPGVLVAEIETVAERLATWLKGTPDEAG